MTVQLPRRSPGEALLDEILDGSAERLRDSVASTRKALGRGAAAGRLVSAAAATLALGADRNVLVVDTALALAQLAVRPDAGHDPLAGTPWEGLSRHLDDGVALYREHFAEGVTFRQSIAAYVATAVSSRHGATVFAASLAAALVRLACAPGPTS